MPSTLPRNVRNAWGEQVADDVAGWLDDNFQQRTVSRDEWREVLSRLDVIDERFDHMDARFDRVEKRLDRMDERFDRMHEAMRSQTRWTVGAIVAVGAILSALLSIAEFAT
jgi:tetrahydromethanopterin S-methyltransferase subunit G